MSWVGCASLELGGPRGDAAMRNNSEPRIIILSDDDRAAPGPYADINPAPEQPMRVVTPGPADQRDPIATISDALVKAFGANACIVVERQIDAAGTVDEAATWNAIWDYLCSPAARRA